jgi:hypothetical protein
MYKKKIRVQQENKQKLPAGYLGKYTAHNDYTEEEMRRILIAPAILWYCKGRGISTTGR